MSNLKHNSWMRNAALVGIGITTTSAALLSSIFVPSIAQNSNANFRDTQNYWAKPFIEALANRNIIKGYPDGTFRPNAAVDRDEFAAILRAAFNKPAERQIGSGSNYRDVPKGYWAAPAIKEAYEAGFMNGYPGGYFRPQQPVTKAEALVSLAQTLNLQPKTPTNQAAANTLNTLQAAAAGTPRNQAAVPQPVRRRSFMLPLAGTMLLQPLMAPVRQAAAALPVQQNAAPQAIAKANTPQSKQKTSSAQAKQNYTQINQYYVDANRIPAYAASSVAEATRSNIVVNHPNVRQLNPQRPATRGEVAAIVYQALVNQGQVPTLGQDVSASRYVVKAENINQSR